MHPTYRYTVTCCLALLLLACSSPQKNKATDAPEKTATPTPLTDADVVGVWRNLSMSITWPNDSVLDVPEGQWEEKLGIKPIVSTFKVDGTLVSEYSFLDNSEARRASGTWKLKGDSLYLTMEDNMTTAYYMTIEGNIGQFTGYLDWDQDGQPRELYHGKQVKE